METYAYVELIQDNGEDLVRAQLCVELPLKAGNRPVIGLGESTRDTSPSNFDGSLDALPGFFAMTILDDLFWDAVKLDESSPVQLKRIKGSSTVDLGGSPLEFLRPEDVPGGQLSQSWRDRLLRDAPRFVLCRVGDAGDQLLIWTSCPGYHAWIAANKQRDQEAADHLAHTEEIKEKKRQQARIEHGNEFINPYTFVPLPHSVQRDEPHGHSAASEGCLTGYVDVTFTLRTPMMLPADWHKDVDTLAPRCVHVPGSSVRGAVRSLYEVITESCLSITDPDYVPVHRANLQANPGDRLAVVSAVDEDDGTPTHVQPTGEVVWVRAPWLHSLWNGNEGAHQLRSGVQISLDEHEAKPRSFGHGVTRQQLEEGGRTTLRLGGDWVVHVADAGTKGGHPADHVFVAVGRLQGEPIELATGAWDRYRQLCRYSQDVEGGTFSPSAPAWDSRDWPGVAVVHERRGGGGKTLIGRRRKSDGTLNVGDSIWIRPGNVKGQTVADGLKMASSWRVLGEHSLKHRLPDSSAEEKSTLLPCTDPNHLCPACAMFGFIEPRPPRSKKRDKQDETHKAEQNAYASHIKFGEFTTTQSVELHKVHPPPLRSPRPSAGNFYLAHPNKEGEYREFGSAAIGNSSARWGVADNPIRKLAGRKFYWHGQEPDQTVPTPRHIRRAHYPALRTPKDKDAERWLMPAESKIQGRVHFENIDRTELAFLLTALCPDRLASLLGVDEPNGNMATHLGGGKSLGYGSATVTIALPVVEDAATRYSNVDASVDGEALLASLPPIPKDTIWLAGLIRVLSSDSVPESRISYPTLGNFNHRNGDNAKTFDESHKFYAAFSGANRPRGADAVQRMRTLPPVNDPNQFMSNEFSEGGH